jgi:hypothetical protein
MNRKRTALARSAAIGIVLALVLSACENSVGGLGGGGGFGGSGGGGKATLQVALGSGQSPSSSISRAIAVYDPSTGVNAADFARMICVFDLTHESGHKESHTTEKGAEYAEFVVFSGKWDIKVLVYLDSVDADHIFAVGHSQVTALPNKSTPVTIDMDPPPSSGGSPAVTGVTVTAGAAAVGQGGTLQFTALVAAQGGASTAVTWAVSGNTAGGTTINGSGLLSVDATETLGTVLTVTATSTYDHTKSGSAAVTVSQAYTWNTPTHTGANGVTPTVSFSPASPQAAVTSVTATVNFTGTATAAGTFSVNLTSSTAGLSGSAQTFNATAGQSSFANKTFSFTVPAANVTDLQLAFSVSYSLTIANVTGQSATYGSVGFTTGSATGNAAGSSVTVTATPAGGYYFVKWVSTDNTGATAVSTSAAYTFHISANTTLYAVFLSPDDITDFGASPTVTYKTFDGTAAANALQTYLTGIMNTPGNYAITVDGVQHEITGGVFPNYTINLGSGVTVSLRGGGTIKKVASTDDYAWYVGNGAKLILRGVTLDGNNRNREVVNAGYGGELVMESGAITGANSISPGGGVSINNGIFTMKGGTIYGNKTAASGGGVINYGGVFTMTGGTITGNEANCGGGSDRGGGVCNHTTFNLNLPATTANIYGNTLFTGFSGVQVHNTGTFQVNGSLGSSY